MYSSLIRPDSQRQPPTGPPGTDGFPGSNFRGRGGFGWLALLVILTAILTMWLTLYPFNFQAQRISSFLAERRLDQVHKINLVLNLALFVPLGLLAGWVWKIMLPRRSLLLVLLVVIDVAILSLTAETLQMWLPEPTSTLIETAPAAAPHVLTPAHAPGRTSSLIDLIANILGGCTGGALGVGLAPALTDRWRRLAHWLSTHPHGKRAFTLLIIVLLARAAPFDATLETGALRAKFLYQTKPAGGPFSATKRWLLGGGGGPGNRPDATTRSEAMSELSRAGLNFALFAVLGFALTAALRERGAMQGRRGSGAVPALLICLILVIATEALQLPIRSRLMDATDPVAGALGASIGVLLGRVSQSRAV